MAATAEDHADSTLIIIGIYPCDEDHGDTKACTKCRFSKYNRNGKMFEKKLSPSDTQKKGSYRLYLRRQDAAKFCHPIFGRLSNGSELIVYDVHVKQHWLVRFRSCGGKHYLTGGWNRFAEDKQLRGGDGITFYDLNPKRETGTRIFMVGIKRKGCIQILGALIN